jgi:hypothetical protein
MSQLGKFNYRSAFDEWCFVQRRLLSVSELEKELSLRSIEPQIPLERGVFEALDRVGIYRPVAYSLEGSWIWNVPEQLAAGKLLIRDEAGYLPWANLDQTAAKISSDSFIKMTPLYSWWQLLSFFELEAALTIFQPWYALTSSEEWFHRRRHQGVAEIANLERLHEWGEVRRARELMLVRTQNVFWPLVRSGKYTGGPVLGLTDDAYGWTIELERTMDFAAAAAECDLTVENLEVEYMQLVRRAQSIDPIGRWFDLIDQIARERREEARGSVRRALDLYDAARVLRGWHRRITGESLPDVDEIVGSSDAETKKRMYGYSDIRNNRAAYPAILERFGVYPGRVQVIAEGRSEVEILKTIMIEHFGVDPERYGVIFLALNGSDVPENADLILAGLRDYVNYYYLLFDNEGTARALIKLLVERKAIEGVSEEQRMQTIKEAFETEKAATHATPEERRAALHAALEKGRKEAELLDQKPRAAPEYLIWKRNLEADNFTLEEVAAVITKAAREEMALSRFTLTSQELSHAVEEEEERPEKKRRGVAAIALGLAEATPGFSLSKPELGKRLARHAFANINLPNGSARPIFEVAEHILRLGGAHRQLRGRLRAPHRSS